MMKNNHFQVNGFGDLIIIRTEFNLTLFLFFLKLISDPQKPTRAECSILCAHCPSTLRFAETFFDETQKSYN